jgi:hypothetical protein
MTRGIVTAIRTRRPGGDGLHAPRVILAPADVRR